MTIHHVAFDESGKEDTEHIVFAGLVSLPARWGAMNQEWSKALADEGLRFWHSVSANNRDGDFKRFRDSKYERDLDLLTLKLVEITCGHVAAGTISYISMKEFKGLDPKAKKRYKNPFYYAFEVGITALTHEHSIPAGDMITLVCDDSEDAARCLEVYKRMQGKNPQMASRIGGICFHDDKVYPPIQASDLYAYCFRRKLTGQTDGIWPDAMTVFEQSFKPARRTAIRID